MTSPSSIPSVGDLQVSQDMRFQRRMWTVQRVGWFGLAVVILMAMLGVLGDGPLSEASARAGDDIEVRYGRVERHRSPSTFVVEVSTELASGGTIELWLDRDFADRLRIESVTPEPESVETSESRVTYTFEVDESAPRARISYQIVPQGIGPNEAAVGVSGGPVLSFRQFVLP